MSFWTVAKAVQEVVETLQKIHEGTTEDLDDKLKSIIYTHAGLAVLSGFVPIPGADLLASAANIWTMYARLNSAIGISFSENSMKTVASGVVANIGAAVGMLLVAGSLAKFIPVLGSFGGGVAVAGIVAAMTLVAAMIYLKAITFLVKKTGGLSFDAEDLKEATKNHTPDKSTLKDIIKENIPSKSELERMKNEAKKEK